jgi:hypothetical protein
MGRPPLDPKNATVKTTLRFTQGVLDRIEALVGPNRIAIFVREAVEEKLKRGERQKPGKDAAEGDA